MVTDDHSACELNLSGIATVRIFEYPDWSCRIIYNVIATQMHVTFSPVAIWGQEDSHHGAETSVTRSLPGFQ